MLCLLSMVNRNHVIQTIMELHLKVSIMIDFGGNTCLYIMQNYYHGLFGGLNCSQQKAIFVRWFQYKTSVETYTFKAKQ